MKILLLYCITSLSHTTNEIRKLASQTNASELLSMNESESMKAHEKEKEKIQIYTFNQIKNERNLRKRSF